MPVFRIRYDRPPGAPHFDIRIFAGKDFDHLALTGTLCMRTDEAGHFLDFIGKVPGDVVELYFGDRRVPAVTGPVMCSACRRTRFATTLDAEGRCPDCADRAEKEG